MAVLRDSKGRFAKRHVEDDTPDLLESERERTVMYMVGLDTEAKNQPVYVIPKAHEVTEINAAGKPVCFPYEHDPSYEVELKSFIQAMNQALNENEEYACDQMNTIWKGYRLFNSKSKHDFAKPKNMPKPKYAIGDEVHAVEIARLLHMNVWPIKGTVIGAMYDYDAKYKEDGKACWKYVVYYQAPADWIDIEHGAKEGDIIEHDHWVNEYELYRTADEAMAALRAYQREITDKYNEIRQRLLKMKPSDVKEIR